MYRIVITLVAVSLGACAVAHLPKSDAEKRAEQTALEKAHKIVAKRGWSLPAGYRAHVDVFHYMPETAEPYDEYWVIFDQPRPHMSPARLYRVCFHRTTGEFTGAYDERRAVRDEEIKVAERAFERRFPSIQYTTIAAPENGIIRLTFLFDKVPRRPGHLTPQRTVVVIVDRATLNVKSFTERHE